MSFPSAVGYLWMRSWRNRTVRQLARLRRPRYLIGALLGLLYLGSLFGWRLRFWSPSQGVPAGVSMFAELSLTTSVMATVFVSWVLGPDQPSLTFTETEVVRFFPAPVTRRALLHYRLVRGLLRSTIGALFATLFVGRVAAGRPFLFFLGASLALGTLFLHQTAASFVRTRLAEKGGWGAAARWTGVGLVLVAVALAVLTALREHPLPVTIDSARELRRWLSAMLETGAVRAVLWPARLLVGPAMAGDLSHFLRALPAALAVLAAHYAWVLWAEVPFEETAVVRAEAKSQTLRSSNPAARLANLNRRKPPFRLAARGRPEVALIWKNLVARRRMAGGVTAFLLFVVAGGLIAALMGDARLFTDTRRVVGPLALVLAVMMTVVGPSAFRMDLRMDLPKLDLLRAMPLRGWQIVGSEMAASALALGTFQWGLLAVALVVGPGEQEAWMDTWWWPGGLALFVLLPSLSLAGLFVQNAAVVLFPSWLPADGERARGIEATGQRLLTMVGSLLVTVLGLVPSALVGGLVGFPLSSLLGAWALPLGALVGACVLVGEVGLGVLAAGRAFERLDLSTDRPGEQI